MEAKWFNSRSRVRKWMRSYQTHNSKILKQLNSFASLYSKLARDAKIIDDLLRRRAPIHKFLYYLHTKGKPYIYYLIDWRHPLNSAAYTIAILLFSCCIYCVLFVIYKLRILAYKHLNKSTFFPPTVQSSNTSIRNTCGNAAPQSPLSISMVLSQTNLAFNSASETIYKS
uniref:Uncharacterized protein n=1 Tax=Glossina austeni TaxID=7395 RepID=A0A1A9UNM2_GLOAU